MQDMLASVICSGMKPNLFATKHALCAVQDEQEAWKLNPFDCDVVQTPDAGCGEASQSKLKLEAFHWDGEGDAMISRYSQGCSTAAISGMYAACALSCYAFTATLYVLALHQCACQINVLKQTLRSRIDILAVACTQHCQYQAHMYTDMLHYNSAAT